MRITFDGRLYKRSAIESAIADYQDFARLSIQEQPGFWIVNANSISEDIRDTFEGEFSNYILARMQG